MKFHDYIIQDELEKKNIKIIRDMIKNNRSVEDVYNVLVAKKHQPALRITKILVKMEKDLPQNFLKQFNKIHQKKKGIEGKFGNGKI